MSDADAITGAQRAVLAKLAAVLEDDPPWSRRPAATADGLVAACVGRAQSESASVSRGLRPDAP